MDIFYLVAMRHALSEQRMATVNRILAYASVCNDVSERGYETLILMVKADHNRRIV